MIFPQGSIGAGSMSSEQQARKRRRIRRDDESQQLSISKKHPLGLQPIGNSILVDNEALQRSKFRRTALLGNFNAWDDDFIFYFLDNYLDARELRNFGYTSRLFSAFTSHEDFWRQFLTQYG